MVKTSWSTGCAEALLYKQHHIPYLGRSCFVLELMVVSAHIHMHTHQTLSEQLAIVS